MSETDPTGTAFAGMSPWMKFMAIVGLPSAGLAYLIYMLVSSFGAQLSSIDRRLDAHEKASVAITEHLQQDADQSWVLISVIQRVCINTSKTEADRIACVSVVPQKGK